MFDAGKYAAFVWPAYGITAAVLLGLLAEALLRARKWRRAAERDSAERSDRP